MDLIQNLIKFVVRFYRRIQSWIWKVHLHMLDENLNKGRPWELLVRFLKALPWQFTETEGRVTHHRENLMILFVIIMVRKVIQNNDVMILLDTQTGGISQRSLEKISMSVYQWLCKDTIDPPKKKNRNSLPMLFI